LRYFSRPPDLLDYFHSDLEKVFLDLLDAALSGIVDPSLGSIALELAEDAEEIARMLEE